MKTNKTSSNNSNVDPVFFGIPLNCSKANRAKYQKLIAGLFLNPKIKSRYVTRYIVQLEKGLISIDRLLKLIDNGVLQGDSFNQPNGSNLSENMHDKIQDWIVAFGEPTDSDWSYLEKNYNLSRALLLGSKNETHQIDFHSPKELAMRVKEYIVGQDNAIDMLSVPFFQQNESKRKGKPCLIKTPSLLIGRTGVGKSAIFQQFARFCKCLVVPINSSEISGTQWKGTHITDKILRAIKDYHGVNFNNIVNNENIINEFICVHLDEADKITHHNQKIAGDSGTDFYTDIMCDLMRLLNPGEYLFLDDGFNQNGSPKGYRIPVDNILVVFAGAFSGIEDIVRKRLGLNRTIGFSQASIAESEIDTLLKQVTADDLVEWGFMPELIGRIGNICVLNSLTPDLIYNIMTNAKDNILQSHIDYCLQYNIELHFTTEALHLIADTAYKSGLGFRNVKTLLSKCLNQLYYELRDEPVIKDMQTVNIDQEYIANHLNLLTK